MIIALLTFIFSFNTTGSNKNYLNKFEIDINRILNINSINSTFSKIEWDHNYVAVYSTEFFNTISKDKPYSIEYNDNQLTLFKSKVKKIILFNSQPWITLLQFPEYQLKNNTFFRNHVDFIIYYPKDMQVDFLGTMYDIKQNSTLEINSTIEIIN